MAAAKVITIDDDPVITQIVRSRLEDAGIPCDSADSAEAALRLMQDHLYFVAICDIHMPGMDGVQLISALKEISPLVQVVMLTADACVAQVISCADRGAVDFFGKDCDYGQIVETVRIALSRRRRWAEWLGRAAQQPTEVGAGK